ncbi:MAG: diguanylate cyclase [Spirochaetales bacterium]|nr:diguanylate cyclase [Spirochaetales bacterium]
MHRDRRGAWTEELCEQVRASHLSTLYLSGVSSRDVRGDLALLAHNCGVKWWDLSLSDKTDEPYEPLLSLAHLCVEQLSEGQRDAILRASIYPPLLPLFQLPLHQPLPLWHSLETPPFEEQDYHAIRQESSVEEFLKLSLSQNRQERWILFPDAVTLPFSTLSVLIRRKDEPAGTVFVIPSGRGPSDLEAEIRAPFLAKLKRKAFVKSFSLEEQTTEFAPEPNDNNVPQKNSLEDVQRFLAWRLWPDARRIIESIERVQQETWTADQHFFWQCLKAELNWGEGVIDQALFNFQSLFSRYQKDSIENRKDQTLLVLALRIAQACFHRAQWEKAKSYALLALSLARGQNRGFQLQAREVLLLIDQEDFCLEADLWKQTYQAVLSGAQDLGWINTLSYWFSRPDRFSPQADWSAVKQYLDQAAVLAQAQDNTFRLAEVYHAQAMVHMAHGENSSVTPFYRKAERLFQNLGSNLKLSQLQNGFGYFCLQVGRYWLAETYFRRAYGTATRIRNVHESAMALRNLGVLYIVCGYFSQAIPYLEELKIIVEEFGLESLSYHTEEGVDVLLALAYAHVNRSRFLSLFHHLSSVAVEPFGSRQISLEERFYLLIVRAHEAHFREEIPLVKQAMDEAQRVVRELPKGLSFLLTFFSREYAELFLSEIKPAVSLMPRPRPVVDFNLIHEAFDLTRVLRDWQQRVQELDFLSAVQDLFQQKRSERELLNQALDLIHLSFPFDLSCVRRVFRRGKVWAQRQPDLWTELDQQWLTETLDTLLVQGDFWRHESLDKAQPSVRFTHLIQIITFAPRSSRWQFFFGGSRRAITIKDFTTLGLACRLLATALDKSEQERELAEFARKVEEKNLKLYEQANHDSLTGLYNRQFLLHKLEAEIHRLQRYPTVGNGLALLFWDLDHFKSYNDLFGHAAGDVILKSVGTMLLSLVRNCDVASRFGGDEFVLLLPETTEDGALRVVERFFSVFAQGLGLHHQLEEFLGHPITPPQPSLTCSVGIAINHPDAVLRADELLSKADEALYRVKRLGKNGVMVAGEEQARIIQGKAD